MQEWAEALQRKLHSDLLALSKLRRAHQEQTDRSPVLAIGGAQVTLLKLSLMSVDVRAAIGAANRPGLDLNQQQRHRQQRSDQNA
jgi:hypothetical protein